MIYLDIDAYDIAKVAKTDKSNEFMVTIRIADGRTIDTLYPATCPDHIFRLSVMAA